jgi:PAS domain S-box-containing protein
MLLQQLPYLLVYISALVLSAVVLYYAWKNRAAAGVRLFAWSILLEISWLIGYFFEVSSLSLSTKIFWDNFQNIGAFLAPTLLVGFVVEFTEIKINTRRLILALSILPGLLLLAIFSYQVSGLVQVNPQIQSGVPFNELTYRFGTISAIGYGYSILLSLAYLVILSIGFFRKISVTRSQLALVLIGTLVPILGFVFGLLFGWKFANQRDISPLTFALSNAIIAFGIFRFRLFSAISIAYQALFETIEDLLIVLDNEDRIVDVNPKALAFLGAEANQIKNVSIGQVLPEMYAQFRGSSEVHTEVVAGSSYFDLKITPIYDQWGQFFGRLIAAHDITAQKKIEQDLQKTNEQNRQRASQFRAIAQVSSSITSVQELQKTLTQIASTLSLQLGHYHVGIFLLDSTLQFAILQAANSQGGQEMLAQDYRLRVRETGIVSTAINSGKVQIALDVDKSRIFHANPYLPHTRSEVAIPIKLRGEMIGVLDIQSLKENAFTTDDLEVFEILASQVGIAIQNARLYEQNIQALQDVEEAYRRLTESTWNSLLQQADVKAYAYDGVSSHPLDHTQNPKPSSLSIPVVVRGKTVGNLRLSPLDPNRTWTDDEIAITNAVAERAALALEAARLLEDAQKRASREAFLSDVAAKLGTSFQLDSILRDTVEELGQSLAGSTVSFQLINPSAPSAAEKSNGQKRSPE